MELLNIINARSVWLFDIAELNPQGRKISPGIVNLLKERYIFEEISPPKDSTETYELALNKGIFQAKHDYPVSVNMKIYSDGVTVDSISSTRHNDDFLEQSLQLCKKEFGLRYSPEMIKRRIYASALNFHSPKSLFGVNERMSEFANKISDTISGEPKPSFDISSFHFSPSPTIPNFNMTEFAIERKLNTLPSEHKYYSRAPLHTDDHLRLLGEFEEIFMG